MRKAGRSFEPLHLYRCSFANIGHGTNWENYRHAWEVLSMEFSCLDGRQLSEPPSLSATIEARRATYSSTVPWQYCFFISIYCYFYDSTPAIIKKKIVTILKILKNTYCHGTVWSDRRRYRRYPFYPALSNYVAAEFALAAQQLLRATEQRRLQFRRRRRVLILPDVTTIRIPTGSVCFLKKRLRHTRGHLVRLVNEVRGLGGGEGGLAIWPNYFASQMSFPLFQKKIKTLMSF
jgi:hypothetical protein